MWICNKLVTKKQFFCCDILFIYTVCKSGEKNMVNSINGINSNSYNATDVTLDSKYDFNQDGKVDNADYKLACQYLKDPEKAEKVQFSQEHLEKVFASMVDEDTIDDSKANEEAENLIAAINHASSNPANAQTLNELQKIGTKLTEYIKQSTQILQMLTVQADSLKAELSELEEEKEQKEAEYLQYETSVKNKTEELNIKIAKSLDKSHIMSEAFEQKCNETIFTAVEAYKNGLYPEQSLADVILKALGTVAGANSATIQKEFNEATELGDEIKGLCADIENIVVDIRDINVRYNEKNELHNTTVNNKTALTEASQKASTMYQSGYTVRQEMRQEIIEAYKVEAGGGDKCSSSNPQVQSLAKFLDNKMLETMPYADAFYILQNTFDGCGIKFDADKNKITIPYGHDATSRNIYNTLVKSIKDNYNLDVGQYEDPVETPTPENPEKPDEPGFIDPDAPADGDAGITRNDPISFQVGDIKYEFIADKNGNGKFDDMTEFLGAENGWDEMIAYDENGDGILSGKELEEMQLVGINQETGQYNFTTAKEAGVGSIDLASFKASNEQLVTGDIVAGNFTVDMANGDKVDGISTLDTSRNIQNKYSNLFGSEIKDMSSSYELNPFMEDFVETTNTKAVVANNEANTKAHSRKAEDILAASENKETIKVHLKTTQAIDEKRRADAKAEEEAKAEEARKEEEEKAKAKEE